MNHEIFLKRFRLLRTLAVGREETFGWCDAFGESCERLETEAFLDGHTAAAPHLLLLDYGALPADETQRKALLEKLRRTPFWQALLFHPEEAATQAREFALRHHFFSAFPYPDGEEAAVRAVTTVLPPLLERLQEHTRTAQLQKIVETAPAQALVAGGGQVQYLNAGAKELFGVTEAKAFQEEVLPRLRKSGLPEKPGESALVVDGETRLLVLCGGSEKEKLYTFVVLDPELNVERKHFLSRVEIIDRLKDRMAQRIDMENPLHVLLVQIANFRNVAENFGWLTAHTVSKEFSEALREHFPAIDTLGLWSGDMVVAIFDGEPTEKIRERLKRFATELQIMEFSEKVTLSADFVLIEVGSDDLNAMINLVSKAYEENLSVTDTKGFTLHRTGTTRETPDEERLLRQFLTNIMANRLPVKLLNIYKGLPISTPTKVLKMDEEKIVVTAEKIQKFVMGIEKSVVIQSPHLPGDVEAEVHFTDPQRPLAILKNPRMLHTSINNRKHTRVTVTSRLPIVLKSGKSQYTGYVVDLSINSIAISFKSGRFAENELKESKVEVSFRLPWENEEGSVQIETAATVLFNREEKEFHKVVVMLEPDDVSESYIFDYIYKRQKELIKEIRQRIG